MGYLFTAFLYALTNFGLNWGECEPTDRNIFIPFDGTHENKGTQIQRDETDYCPSDFDEFGEF